MTVVSARVFHVCDQGLIPTLSSCLNIISPQSHVRRVPYLLKFIPQFFPDNSVSSCSNNVSLAGALGGSD
jgi:hypothetical protein